jgi:hypothetical protein
MFIYAAKPKTLLAGIFTLLRVQNCLLALRARQPLPASSDGDYRNFLV